MKSQRPNYSSEKAERLEARLSRQQKELIQHAADLAGRSLTDFILSASQEAANKVIREHEVSDEGYAMCHVITTDSLEKAWRNAQVSQGMRELMNEGRVQVLWCPDENDFVFQSTDNADPYGRIS